MPRTESLTCVQDKTKSRVRYTRHAHAVTFCLASVEKLCCFLFYITNTVVNLAYATRLFALIEIVEIRPYAPIVGSPIATSQKTVALWNVLYIKYKKYNEHLKSIL